MNIAVLELETKIRKIVANDNGRVAVFEYEKQDPKIGFLKSGDSTTVNRLILTVSTFNESTRELTVMYTTKPMITQEACLAEVVNYLEVIKPTLSPYTMIWKKKGEPDEATHSYFYCNDMLEVLERFFATRKKEEYVIYSLEMKGYT